MCLNKILIKLKLSVHYPPKKRSLPHLCKQNLVCIFFPDEVTDSAVTL